MRSSENKKKRLGNKAEDVGDNNKPKQKKVIKVSGTPESKVKTRINSKTPEEISTRRESSTKPSTQSKTKEKQNPEPSIKTKKGGYLRKRMRCLTFKLWRYQKKNPLSV
jgi:hypothetical protein